jgi:hypothetical protein
MLPRSRELPPGTNAMEQVAVLLRSCSAAFKATNGTSPPEKEYRAALISGVALAGWLIALDPAQVLDPSFGNLLSDFYNLPLPRKKVEPELRHLARQAARVMELLARHASSETRTQLRQIVDLYATQSDLFLAEVQRISSLLQSVDPADTDSSERRAGYAFEEALSSLVVSVELLHGNFPNDPIASQVLKSTARLADTCGITRLGTVAEVLKFNPFQHELVEAGTEAPGQVQVVTPGLAFLRADGSCRTILKAVVRSTSA